jgi:hypothetical protein
MKNILKAKKIIILVVIFCLSIFKFNTYSLMVEQDPIGIYCIKDNGTRAISEWVEIDFEGDSYLEYYYFDANGYLIMNGMTPDGYMVNERGQWVVNGVIQRKSLRTGSLNKNKEEKSKDINQINLKNNNNSNRNIDISFVFAIIFLIIILILYIKLLSSESSRNEYKSKNDDRKETKESKSEHKKKNNTSIDNDTAIERSIWWHFRSDTDKIGEEGEDEAAEELKNIGKEFIVLRNVNLPRKNKEPVQIDFLCISKKGIFVIEVKSWLGKITGDYNVEKWYSQIYDIINEQKNPIKQNERHIDVLKRFIKQNMTYYSIIVFTDRSDISWIDKEQNKTYITNINYLNSKIYSIYESSDVKSYSNYKSVAGYLRRFVV